MCLDQGVSVWCLYKAFPCRARHSAYLGPAKHRLPVPSFALTSVSSAQPKQAVEFDQAINYVNKIKVGSPKHMKP